MRVLEFDGVGMRRDALYRVPYECCVVGHCWGDVGRLLEVGALVSGCCNDPTGGGGLWGDIGRRFEGRGVRFVFLRVRNDEEVEFLHCWFGCGGCGVGSRVMGRSCGSWERVLGGDTTCGRISDKLPP